MHIFLDFMYICMKSWIISSFWCIISRNLASYQPIYSGFDEESLFVGALFPEILAYMHNFRRFSINFRHVSKVLTLKS